MILIARNRWQQAFTLVELLVVIVIMASVAAIVSVQIIGRLDSVKISTAGREIAAALRYTRSQALLTQQAQAVQFDVEKKTYTAPGKDAVVLPEELEIELFTANSEVQGGKTGAIRFYPDGGSTGGAVTLRTNGREWKVLVGWLTGEIQFKDSARDRAQARR